MQTVRLGDARRELKQASAVQRSTAQALAIAQGNVAVLRSSLEIQNDALASIGVASEAAIREGRSQVKASEAATAAADAARLYMLNRLPVGADVCVRLIEADKAFMETLQ